MATNSIDRFITSLGMVAQVRPEVLDKFDPDRWADVYADALGIDPQRRAETLRTKSRAPIRAPPWKSPRLFVRRLS